MTQDKLYLQVSLHKTISICKLYGICKLCVNLYIPVVSFPDSTPQLFIAPLYTWWDKSWGVGSGNEAIYLMKTQTNDNGGLYLYAQM